jgi:membrane protein CcdC involved in cytochrome C biogenesis
LALIFMSTACGMYLKKYFRCSCFDEVTELSVSVI